MTGKEYFDVKRVDGEKYGLSGRVRVLELSAAARAIDENSIIMVRGLPTLQSDGEMATGEYVHMNTGQHELETLTWTDDKTLDPSRARYATWNRYYSVVFSIENYSNDMHENLGSRGVLRVNLNFED